MKPQWKKILRNLSFLLSLPVIVTAFVFARQADREEVLMSIQVHIENAGLSFVTEQDVLNITNSLAVEPGETKLHRLNIHQLEQTIGLNPWVNSVDCFIGNGGVLYTKISQKVPVVRIITSDSSAYGYYLDKYANPIPLSDVYVAQVPVVSSYKLGYTNAEVQLKKELVVLANYLKTDMFWNEMITQIQVDQHKGIELIPALGHHVIRLGDTRQLNQRMNQLKSFYRQGMSVIDWNRYDELDIRYLNQVIARQTAVKELIDPFTLEAEKMEREKQKQKLLQSRAMVHIGKKHVKEPVLVKTSKNTH